MLNKSENSTKIGASKEPTRTKTTDGTYMPSGLMKKTTTSSSARTRPASRSRSRSKSGTRKNGTLSRRAGTKVYTKKELEEEKTKKNVEVKKQVEENAETLEPIDNNYDLINSPANIKTSSILIEQQHLPLLHQAARYELRQRNSPFVSKTLDPHLMRNSTPVQTSENKIMKLRLEESFNDDEEAKRKEDVEIQNVGLNNNQNEEKEANKSSLVANSSSKVISTICVLQDWKKYIRYFALFLILISFVTLLYFNKKSYNYVLSGTSHVVKSIDHVKDYFSRKFLSS